MIVINAMEFNHYQNQSGYLQNEEKPRGADAQPSSDQDPSSIAWLLGSSEVREGEEQRRLVAVRLPRI